MLGYFFATCFCVHLFIDFGSILGPKIAYRNWEKSILGPLWARQLGFSVSNTSLVRAQMDAIWPFCQPHRVCSDMISRAYLLIK